MSTRITVRTTLRIFLPLALAAVASLWLFGRTAQAAPNAPVFQLTNTQSGATATVGQQYTWTMTVKNTGADPTTSAQVIVDHGVPGAFTNAQATGDGWACAMQGSTLMRCTRSGTLAPGASFPTITITATAAQCSSVIVSVYPYVSGGGTATTAYGSRLETEMRGCMAFTLTQTQNAPTAQVGQQHTWTLTVKNSGQAATINTPVTLDLGVPSTFASIQGSGSGWACGVVGASTMRCTRSDVLAVNASYPAVTVTATATNCNQAEVSTLPSVSGGGTNSYSSPERLYTDMTGCQAFTLTHTQSAPSVPIGQPYSWTMTARNSGPAPTTATLVTMDLGVPSTFSNPQGSGQGWACSVVGASTVRCTRSDALAAGASYPTVTVTATATGCGSARVSTEPFISGGGTHSYAYGTRLYTDMAGCASFQVTKTAAQPEVSIGGTQTWTVTVKNTGIAASAGDVTMDDPVPSTFANVQGSGNGWTCSLVGSRTMRCTRADALAAGASFPPITITATADNCSRINVTNTAAVSGGGSQGYAESAGVPTKMINCGSISGQVTLEGRTNMSPGGTGFGAGFGMATVTAHRTDSTEEQPDITVNANAGGSFSLADLPTGTYTITAAAPGYLPAVKTGVVVVSGSIVLNAVQLRAGLVTPDQLVNIHDITVACAAFGQSMTNRQNAAGRIVDLNGDGMVTIADIVLAIGNFGKSGAQPWN